MVQSDFVSVAPIALQACAIDHSGISPFRIKCLQPQFSGRFANCVPPPNVP